MDANLHRFLSPNSLFSTILSLPKSSPSPHSHTIFLPPLHRRSLRIRSINNSTSDSSSNNSVPPPVPPPETLEIRFRRRSKKRSRKEGNDGAAGEMQRRMAEGAAEAPKKWEEMSLAEKAIELYVGEKGLLFWLNKFAYASIFIVIGGWILFRFVGPSLNLYQLDTPPLSPTSILKG